MLRGACVAFVVVALAVFTACNESKVVQIGTDTPAPSDSTDEPTTTATKTQRPTYTPYPVATQKLGTRDNPVPIGVPVSFDDGWSIKVVSAIPDATALVMQENQFNDPPVSGNQFFIATVAATYNGPASETFGGAYYGLNAVGPGAVSYSTYENSCGVIPDDFPGSEVFPGGTVQGNICWSVTAADAAALVMYYDPFLESAERVFWDVTP